MIASIVEVYWEWLGCYLGRGFGLLVDLVPFAVSEAILQLSMWLCLLLMLSFLSGHPIPKFTWIGVLFLFIMIGSQGITSFDWVPSARRETIKSRLALNAVKESELNDFLQIQKDLLKQFPVELYQKAALNPPLEIVQQSLTKALHRLKLKPGREVRAVKEMWGITRLLGLAYGGPAYHDVITSEVVVASESDYPASKAWRWMCVLHEAAHAQGFTREMDAEILTWLALIEADDPLFNALAAWMVLFKAGQTFELPTCLKTEFLAVEQRRKDLNQVWVQWLKRVGQKISLQNSEAKYGSVERDSIIPLDHEFFATVTVLSQR